MGIDKDKLLGLLYKEDYQGLKAELNKSDFSNKKELLSKLALVEVSANDLATYNGLVQNYGETDLSNKIKKELRTNKAALAEEIYKIK